MISEKKIKYNWLLSSLLSCFVSLHIMRVSGRQIIVPCFHANKIPEGKNILKNQKPSEVPRIQLLWACITLSSPFSQPLPGAPRGSVPGEAVSCEELWQNAGHMGNCWWVHSTQRAGAATKQQHTVPHCKTKSYRSSVAVHARRNNLKSLRSFRDARSEPDPDISGELKKKSNLNRKIRLCLKN